MALTVNKQLKQVKLEFIPEPQFNDLHKALIISKSIKTDVKRYKRARIGKQDLYAGILEQLGTLNEHIAGLQRAYQDNIITEAHPNTLETINQVLDRRRTIIDNIAA